MRKAIAIGLMAILVVTFSMATAQIVDERTRKMIMAIMLDNINEVKKLIEAGADLNEKFDFGASKDITILVFAVMGGYSDKADILKVLIDAGADINVKFQGMTLLHVAAMHGDLSGAKTELLITKGLDVNAKIISSNLEGTTPLHLAAGKGNIKVAEVLIKNGAEVDAKDSKQYKTPLQLAAQNGHKAVAVLLIAKGADVNAKEGYYGETPLYLAISKGHKELADLLRKHGGVIRKK